MARASPLRSGDCLAGLAAQSAERVAAKSLLSEIPLDQLGPLTRLYISDKSDRQAWRPLPDGLRIGNRPGLNSVTII